MTDPRILTLGLTGGIGSGKSYIAELLTARGIPVYDSDARAKALYFAKLLSSIFPPPYTKPRKGSWIERL